MSLVVDFFKRQRRRERGIDVKRRERELNLRHQTYQATLRVL